MVDVRLRVGIKRSREGRRAGMGIRGGRMLETGEGVVTRWREELYSFP